MESPAEPRVHLGKLFLQNCCFQLDAAWSLKEAAWSTWPLMRFNIILHRGHHVLGLLQKILGVAT